MNPIHKSGKINALQGSTDEMPITANHILTGRCLKPPFPKTLDYALFGLGCFWGAERLFWQQQGVFITAVGYAGGLTSNPSYTDLCSGQTGHAEVVRVIFNPKKISYQQLLTIFWENHNPTQGMRQGNDIGTQYRSVIFTHNLSQHNLAEDSRTHYQHRLSQAGITVPITTEITPAPTFYYAEQEHQQYLAKNPQGYCSLEGFKISFN